MKTFKQFKEQTEEEKFKNNMKKAQTGLKNKLRDPNTQQKFDNFSRMLKSLSVEK